jgi:hypothetical protein
MIFFEGYLEILISSLLSLKGAVRINRDDQFSYKLSLILPVVIFTVVPLMIIYALVKP